MITIPRTAFRQGGVKAIRSSTLVPLRSASAWANVPQGPPVGFKRQVSLFVNPANIL